MQGESRSSSGRAGACRAQPDDQFLAGGGLVELAAHFGEPVARLGFQPIDPLVELVEAARSLVAESVDDPPVGIELGREVGQIAVTGGGQVPRGRRVSGHLLEAGFHRGQPGFKVREVGHVGSVPAAAGPGPRPAASRTSR
ncbi:MAG: hypothetical protein ACR2G2_19190 [Pseudonocardia sp.]